MKKLYIRADNSTESYCVDSDNIFKVFSELTNEERAYIVEESVKEFLLTMINPDSYSDIDKDAFSWQGNSFYPPIHAWFE